MINSATSSGKVCFLANFTQLCDSMSGGQALNFRIKLMQNFSYESIGSSIGSSHVFVSLDVSRSISFK